MIGWRGKIGVIYPSDGILDGEFWRCVPPGVSVHVTRSLTSLFMASDLSPAQRLEAMVESRDIDDAARTFSLIGAGCVAYACTSASFIRGAGYDGEIIRRIEAASGSPATTTTTALVAALRELGVRRLAVAAPYKDEVCARLRTFFDDSGFDVVSLKNLNLFGMALGAVPSEQVYALGRQADTPEADGLLIACTAFRAVEILDALEQDLGKPVVSANQATMWHALRLARIDARLDGLGRLFRLGAPARPDDSAGADRTAASAEPRAANGAALGAQRAPSWSGIADRSSGGDS
jgi:maleate isomerase